VKALFEVLEDPEVEAMKLFGMHKSSPSFKNIKQKANLLKKFIVDEGKIVELPKSY
jgi:hypothetical protein